MPTQIKENQDSSIEELFWGKAQISNAFAVFDFKKKEHLQQLIHQLKYNGVKRAGKPSGRLLAQKVQYLGLQNSFDAITTVPLHKRKKRKRGYNQADLIAEEVAKQLQVPFYPKLLKRVKNSTTQTHKTVYERANNMASNFVANPKLALEPMHILIIDDVITTGATLCSCANALLTKGHKVSVAALAFRNL